MSAVSEIMSNGKIVALNLKSDPSVLDVIMLMLKKKVGSVVLLDQTGGPAGIVTERDILRKVSAVSEPPGSIKAQEVMSAPVITIKPFDSVETAASLMTTNKIKRLVVVEQDGSMAGVISITDIAAKLAKILADDFDRYGRLKAMLENN